MHSIGKQYAEKQGKHSGINILLPAIVLILSFVAAGLTLTASLTHNKLIPLQATSILAKGIVTAALFGGALLAAKRAERGKLVYALLSSLSGFLLILGGCALAGKWENFHFSAMSLLAAGGGICGGLLGSRRKRLRYL